MRQSLNVPSCFLPDRESDLPVPVYICRPDGLEELRKQFSQAQNNWLAACDFGGKAGQMVRLARADGSLAAIVFGAGECSNGYTDGEMQAGALAEQLDKGQYVFASLPEDWNPDLAALFWGLGAYKFDRYCQSKYTPPILVAGENVNTAEVGSHVMAVHMGRDLINTPASDMGPEHIEQRARDLAEFYGAKISVVCGDALLEENFPLIHAVGRAAQQAPRLIMLEWGRAEAPGLALVGKGISFDTGGLDIKSATGMRLMKKDMGGAAHALTLGAMIMAGGLDLHLRIYLAVAENAISGNAYRPGDVLTSRKGLTVEIDNTDAEGRLVLADALTKACEDGAHLVMDFATLTGAARVALGPTLPPFFSNRQEVVQPVMEFGTSQKDPLWPMPLWAPYERLFNSPIADMKNAGGSFAGSVTAALFLQKFTDGRPWMHFDVFGWNPQSSPAHPKGGEIFAVRALYHWLKSGGMDRL